MLTNPWEGWIVVPSSKRKFYFAPSIPCLFWDKYFLVAHFLHALRFPAFCNRDRKSKTSMMSKYLGGRSNSSRTAGLQLQIFSSFSLRILRLSLEFLPAQQCIWKDTSHTLSSVFNCFVVEILYELQSILLFSPLSLSKNSP